MLSPETVCQVYQEAGYSFIAVTDHFSERYNFPITDTQTSHGAAFITLLGAELHAPATELGDEWHILAVGLPTNFAPTAKTETAPELTARALAAGAFVAAAHPHWYNLSENDIHSLGQIHAIETYNGTAIDDSDRADSWYLLDNLLARGGHYFACTTDDAHFDPARSDALRAWVWVKCPELEDNSLLTALKAGDYYSSTGPLIHAIDVIAGEKVVVHCSPADRIFVTGKGANFVAAHGTNLIEAEISLRNFTSPYCRITVRDVNGNRAWSNPIWF